MRSKIYLFQSCIYISSLFNSFFIHIIFIKVLSIFILFIIIFISNHGTRDWTTSSYNIRAASFSVNGFYQFNMTPRSYFLIKSLYDIYSISSCLKEVEKGDLYDDQYNNSPREGKKENENGNNNEYDHRPTILGGNAGLPNGGKSLHPAACIFPDAYRFLNWLLRDDVVRCSFFQQLEMKI